MTIYLWKVFSGRAYLGVVVGHNKIEALNNAHRVFSKCYCSVEFWK